jgi:putative intracellular protease/amidase
MGRSGNCHDRRLRSPRRSTNAADRNLRLRRLRAIDVFGFAEAFTIAQYLGRGYGDPPPYPFAVTLIGSARHGVKSANGPTVLPDLEMEQALDDPPDLLMIPGGGGTWPLLDSNADPERVAALLQWVRRMDGEVKLMTSVCTGAAVLARAGLLDGRPAATNHGAFAWVAQHLAEGSLGQRVALGRPRPLRDVRRRLGGNGSRLLPGVEVGRPRRRRNCRPGRGIRLAPRPRELDRLPADGGGLIARIQAS